MTRKPDNERPDADRDSASLDPDENTESGQGSQRDRASQRFGPDLEQRRLVRGRLPGNQYVRIVRPFAREFRRRASGHLVATERVLEPRGPVGRAFEWMRRILIGPRIPTDLELQERVGIGKGLAIFASDNISSSAYATEEIMRVLVLAGTGALALTLPISLAIVVVLAIVVTSYQQIIRAYPSGGGSYAVANENLGTLPGLPAAAALLIDYILTVSVSVAAGVVALASISPILFAYRVELGVVFVVLLCVGNLRGI